MPFRESSTTTSHPYGAALGVSSCLSAGTDICVPNSMATGASVGSVDVSTAVPWPDPLCLLRTLLGASLRVLVVQAGLQ